MSKLFCDLKSDEEKYNFFLFGHGYETGVISITIQNDVALAYKRCCEFSKALAAERKRREEAEAERDGALAALNTERTMREAAAAALSEWDGSLAQGRRIIEAEAFKRLLKQAGAERDALQADAARLREALQECCGVLDHVRDRLGICGPGDGGDRRADADDLWGINIAMDTARIALNHEPGKGDIADPCVGCAYDKNSQILRANCMGCAGFAERPHKVAAGPDVPNNWWEAKHEPEKEKKDD